MPAGPTEPVIRRLDQWIVVVSTQPPVQRAILVACWCARAIVESTATDQSSTPAASALAVNTASTAFHVPSAAIAQMPVPHRLPRHEHLGQIT